MSNEHWWTNKHMEWIMRTSVFITPSSPISHSLTVGTLRMFNMNCTVHCVVCVILWTLLISFHVAHESSPPHLHSCLVQRQCSLFRSSWHAEWKDVSRNQEVLLCTWPTLNTKSLSFSHEMNCIFTMEKTLTILTSLKRNLHACTPATWNIF